MKKYLKREEVIEKMKNNGAEIYFETYSYWNGVPVAYYKGLQLVLAVENTCMGSTSLNTEFTYAQMEKILKFIDMLIESDVFKTDEEIQVVEKVQIDEDEYLNVNKFLINKKWRIETKYILELSLKNVSFR